MADLLDRAKWLALNILQALFLALWSAFWMPTAALCAVFLPRSGLGLSLGRTIWSPVLMRAAGARVDVRGLENIDAHKPYVFVLNHQSMIDIPIAFMAFPMNIHFIAKKELLAVPFLGRYIRASGMIAVDRNKGPEAVRTLQESARVLVPGKAVVAFAEGTRSRQGVIGPFKKGAFMLALQAQVPIVPVAIEGARDVLPSDGFRVRPGVIRVQIGAPIPTTGKGPEHRDALMAQARDEVVRMNLALGGKGGDPVVVELQPHKRPASPVAARL